MQESVLLCISTLLDGSNHYSTPAFKPRPPPATDRLPSAGKMFELTGEDGQPLFKQIAITLVCDTCKSSDHPEKCESPRLQLRRAPLSPTAVPPQAPTSSRLSRGGSRRKKWRLCGLFLPKTRPCCCGRPSAFPPTAPSRHTASPMLTDSSRRFHTRSPTTRGGSRKTRRARPQPAFPPHPTRLVPAVRVFRGCRSFRRWSLCFFDLLCPCHERESAPGEPSGSAARRSFPPHMLMTTLAATTSRSGFCKKALM